MSIIDKLGIKPIRVYKESNHHRLHCYCLPADTQKLEQQRNEMLEALIRNLELNQRGYFMKQKVLKDIIEKADTQHRSWSQIKELL